MYHPDSIDQSGDTLQHTNLMAKIIKYGSFCEKIFPGTTAHFRLIFIQLNHSGTAKSKTHSYKCIINPTALRKANIVYNFGLSECNRVNMLCY